MNLNDRIPDHQVLDKCNDGEHEIEIDINFYNPAFEFPNYRYETIIIMRYIDPKTGHPKSYANYLYQKALTDEQVQEFLTNVKANPKKFKNQ